MELFSKKEKGWLRVLTGSMLPGIHPGDQVLVCKVVAEGVHLGDTIVFRRGDDMIVHRILKKWHTTNGINFREKGDSNQFYGVFEGDKVIGCVIMVEGSGRTLGFSSPLSRLINLALSEWFYLTYGLLALLKSSMRKNIRRVGGVFARLLRLSSRVLVRLCYIVWYLSGFSAKSNPGANSKTR